MAKPNSIVHRREFYMSTGGVYNLIGLVSLGVSRVQTSTLMEIAMLIVTFGAMLTGLAFMIQGLRTPAPRPETETSS